MQKPKTIDLSAALRQTGDAEAAGLRQEFKVPAVLYGPKLAENKHFWINEIELERLLAEKNVQFVNLKFEDGSTYQTIIKKSEFHPVTDRPLHVDFYVLDAEVPVTVTVPIELVGTAKGVTVGGRLVKPTRSIKVKAILGNLPALIEADVTKLRIGQTLRVSDLNIEGIQIMEPATRTLAQIKPPKGGKGAPAAIVEDDEEVAEEA